MGASFWQPAILNQPPVQYPELPFQQAQRHAQVAGPAAAYRQSAANEAQNKTASMMNQGMLSSANSFGWGGNSMNGFAPTAFPNHTGTPNNYQATYNVGGVGASGGGGYGAYGGGNLGQLASWYQNSLNNANQANEARYRDILGGYQDRYQRGLGMLSGLGQQEGRDINQLYDQQGAKVNQDLIGRGLGNSTVLSTMQMGNNRDRNADLGRLNDRVRQQALTTDQNLSGDALQFMERKTDKAPDISTLLSLYQGMGQAGYGGGFGGVPIDMGSGGGGYGQYGQAFNPYMYASNPYLGGYSNSGGSSNNRDLYAFKNQLANAFPTQTTPVSHDYAASWIPTPTPNADTMNAPASWFPSDPNLLNSMGDSSIANAIRSGYTGGGRASRPEAPSYTNFGIPFPSTSDPWSNYDPWYAGG